MKTIKLLVLLMVVALGMQSCREDSDIINVTPPTPQTGMTVTSSVLGTVVDENGQAVAGATVTFGDLTETTDQYGVFQFNDETMFIAGTYIEVEKDGYFHGSRKYYPTANSVSRVKIELIPMVEVASFSSATGENVQFEGVDITFGANSIMREDGSDYDGNVKVFAKYLDPTLSSTLDQMPGDLTAMNASDERVVLTTFGMIAVELRDNAGSKLQVRDGSQAEISMPVPTEILSSAPETIPLWHFDEDMGTWIEEGVATLVNGAYVGQVSHFSYWNCDVPANFIHLSGSIFNRGVPVQGLLVVITNTADNATGSGYTNNQGVFGGFVPNGEVLTIEIFDQCGTLIYTTTVGPYEEDVVLDPFNLTITAQQATIVGSVEACEGDPSEATYVLIEQDELFNIVTLEEDNSFIANIFYCEDGGLLTVGAKDPINQLASANTTFTIEGDVDAGVLNLCEELVTPFLRIEYGDEEYNSQFSETLDSLILPSYTIENLSLPGEPTKEKYTVFYLDWNTNSVFEFELIYEEGVPNQEAKLAVAEAGFIARGESSVQLVAQGGKTYIVSSGILDDMEVTDATVYDSSFNPCTFNFIFEKY